MLQNVCTFLNERQNTNNTGYFIIIVRIEMNLIKVNILPDKTIFLS